jgi:hypothetical protein
LLTGLTWLRDEWLTPEQAAKWKLPALIPGAPLDWLIATLLLVLIFVLEGSYRVLKREAQSNKDVGADAASVQEPILPDPPYITLYEAARRCIDENIGIYDGAARQLSGDDPVGWWAYWIRDRTKVYGKFLPARTFRPFPQDGYFIILEGENLVAVEKSNGKGKWTDLSILASEMPRLLEEAKGRAGLLGHGIGERDDR